MHQQQLQMYAIIQIRRHTTIRRPLLPAPRPQSKRGRTHSRTRKIQISIRETQRTHDAAQIITPDFVWRGGDAHNTKPRGHGFRIAGERLCRTAIHILIHAHTKPSMPLVKWRTTARTTPMTTTTATANSTTPTIDAPHQ